MPLNTGVVGAVQEVHTQNDFFIKIDRVTRVTRYTYIFIYKLNLYLELEQVNKMKDLVIETIRLYFGYLEGVPTEEFYNEYLKICSEHNAEPLSRFDVTRIASDLSGCHSKRKVIRIFTNKD